MSSSSVEIASVETGRNGLSKVVLSLPSSSSSSSAEVYLLGATITSWKTGAGAGAGAAGVEHLFLSSQSHFDLAKKPIRGGIPLVFPQFGPGVLPQHGFARNTLWSFDGASLSSSSSSSSPDVVAKFSLSDTPATRAGLASSSLPFH